MGGIGNQLFQYATALALSEKYERSLCVDKYLGFILDFQYKRIYLLDCFSTPKQTAKPFTVLRFALFLVVLKSLKRLRLLKNKEKIHHKFLGDAFILEPSSCSFSPEAINFEARERNCHIHGYWQSPLYFQAISEKILSELEIPKPSNSKLLKLGACINSGESLAIGLRLYEESKDPSAHFRDGISKGITRINWALQKIIEQVPFLKFYVFCSHLSPVIDQIKFPDEATLVTPEYGFSDPLESLWLFSQAKHHLITTSSFYWWGAWLSQKNHNLEEQVIYAPDNFINEYALPTHWKTY